MVRPETPKMWIWGNGLEYIHIHTPQNVNETEKMGRQHRKAKERKQGMAKQTNPRQYKDIIPRLLPKESVSLSERIPPPRDKTRYRAKHCKAR